MSWQNPRIQFPFENKENKEGNPYTIIRILYRFTIILSINTGLFIKIYIKTRWTKLGSFSNGSPSNQLCPCGSDLHLIDCIDIIDLHVGMISLINHDSRLWENSEVVIIYPYIYIYIQCEAPIR